MNEFEELRAFEEYRLRLIEFYKRNNPEALASVDDTLAQWRGNETELFQRLEAKYGASTRSAVDRRNDEDYARVVEGLKKIYKKSVRPLEDAFKFDRFFAPMLEDADFEAKPMVLLLGQYSVGKTTFIRSLINRDFPGMRIGPEPTTDRFVAIMHGARDASVPGNALAVDESKPFRGLQSFGTSFLNRLEASTCSSTLLESISFIDTPGVLSGEKQRIGRNYDFEQVVEWFATRCDRILLLFDAHKLDVSDEFKRVIESLKGHDDKIRVVLNKADSVSPPQLMRVFGALNWSLARVMKSPEVPRIYVSSFFDEPLDPAHENFKLFESEKNDLMADLLSLPRNSATRKLNECVKRTRMARTHAKIVASLAAQMPTFMGKAAKQKQLLDNLPDEFAKMATRERIAPGDFPSVARFRDTMKDLDLSQFSSNPTRLIAKIDAALAVDVPNLMRYVGSSEVDDAEGEVLDREAAAAANPFGDSFGEAQSGAHVWAVSNAQKTRYDNIFYSLELSGAGRLLSGKNAKGSLESTGVSRDDLFKVWNLSDVDRDAHLDAEEFAVAMYLCEARKAKGFPIPDVLPPSLVPPSKRALPKK